MSEESGEPLMRLEGSKWETFLDHSYYDMWCVRPVGSRTFGEGFHLISETEARALAEMLSAPLGASPQASGEDGR